jgi:hypothetical protein
MHTFQPEQWLTFEYYQTDELVEFAIEWLSLNERSGEVSFFDLKDYIAYNRPYAYYKFSFIFQMFFDSTKPEILKLKQNFGRNSANYRYEERFGDLDDYELMEITNICSSLFKRLSSATVYMYDLLNYCLKFRHQLFKHDVLNSFIHKEIKTKWEFNHQIFRFDFMRFMLTYHGYVESSDRIKQDFILHDPIFQTNKHFKFLHSLFLDKYCENNPKFKSKLKFIRALR